MTEVPDANGQWQDELPSCATDGDEDWQDDLNLTDEDEIEEYGGFNQSDFEPEPDDEVIDGSTDGAQGVSTAADTQRPAYPGYMVSDDDLEQPFSSPTQGPWAVSNAQSERVDARQGRSGRDILPPIEADISQPAEGYDPYTDVQEGELVDDGPPDGIHKVLANPEYEQVNIIGSKRRDTDQVAFDVMKEHARRLHNEPGYHVMLAAHFSSSPSKLTEQSNGLFNVVNISVTPTDVMTMYNGEELVEGLTSLVAPNDPDKRTLVMGTIRQVVNGLTKRVHERTDDGGIVTRQLPPSINQVRDVFRHYTGEYTDEERDKGQPVEITGGLPHLSRDEREASNAYIHGERRDSIKPTLDEIRGVLDAAFPDNDATRLPGAVPTSLTRLQQHLEAITATNNGGNGGIPKVTLLNVKVTGYGNGAELEAKKLSSILPTLLHSNQFRVAAMLNANRGNTPDVRRAINECEDQETTRVVTVDDLTEDFAPLVENGAYGLLAMSNRMATIASGVTGQVIREDPTGGSLNIQGGVNTSTDLGLSANYTAESDFAQGTGGSTGAHGSDSISWSKTGNVTQGEGPRARIADLALARRQVAFLAPWGEATPVGAGYVYDITTRKKIPGAVFPPVDAQALPVREIEDKIDQIEQIVIEERRRVAEVAVGGIAAITTNGIRPGRGGMPAPPQGLEPPRSTSRAQRNYAWRRQFENELRGQGMDPRNLSRGYLRETYNMWMHNNYVREAMQAYEAAVPEEHREFAPFEQWTSRGPWSEREWRKRN